MSDIVEFLKARLDEDEAAALSALNYTRIWRDDPQLEAERWEWSHHAMLTTGGGATANYRGAPSPDRVLHEVEAKRDIIKGAELYSDAAFPDYDGGYASASEDAVRALASAYSDHPDYRAEWEQQ